MTKEDNKKFSVVEFVLRVCSLERFIEVKRQMLCDKEDFQPYVAFMRINRDSGHAITPSMVHKFLSENLLDVSLRRCQVFVDHYDVDRDGLLSYKEFIEVLLPREHPELRAFVSQQECFSLSRDEFLSYETECCLASLIEREVYFFEDSREQRQAMHAEYALSPAKILELIDTNGCGNINFNNLQKFLNGCGLLPYDAEIINFLRRLDKDDDGVVNNNELDKFLKHFDLEGADPYGSLPRPSKLKDTSRGVSEEKVRKHSPHRKVIDLHKSKAQAERANEDLRSSISQSRLIERSSRPADVSSPPDTKSGIHQRPSEKRTPNVQTLQYSNRRPVGQTVDEKHDSSSSYKLKPMNNDHASNENYRRMLESQIGHSNQTNRRHTPTTKSRYDESSEHENVRERERPQNRERAYGKAEQISIKPDEEKYSQPGSGISRSRSQNRTLAKKVTVIQPPLEEHSRHTHDSYSEQNYPRQSNVFKQEPPAPSKREVERDLKRSQVGNGPTDRDRSQPPQTTNIRSAHQSISERGADSRERDFVKPPSSNNSVESKSSEAIYKAFKMILNQERNLELARRELVTKNDFDVAEIFSRIDKKGRNWFTIEDFRVFLGEIGLKNIETRSLIDLYSSYDVSQSCLLNFEQLVNMLCPMDNRFAVYLNKSERRELSESTTELLADVFNRQFSMRKSLVDAKRLIKNENLDLNIIFDVIDGDQKGYISFHDIYNFLNRFEVMQHDKDIDIMIESLIINLDVDNDGQVSFKDFYMFFSL